MDILTARKLASHFSLMNRGQLSDFSALPDVSMSYASLSALQAFYNNTQHRAPTQEEFILLDGLMGNQKRSASHYSAGSVTLNNKKIADTLKDMMEKYAVIHPDYDRPCSLEQAMSLGGNAVAYGDPRSFSLSEHTVFSANDEKLASLESLIKGYEAIKSTADFCISRNIYSPIRPKKLNPRTRYTAVIIYSKEDGAYEKLAELISRKRTFKKAYSVSVAKGKDIFNKIIGITPNIFLDAEKMPLEANEADPEINATEGELLFKALSDALFTEKGFGEYALAVFVRGKKYKALCSRAKKLGLDVCTAMTVSKDPNFCITRHGAPIVNIRSDLLRIATFPEISDIVIADPEVSSFAPDVKTIFSDKNEKKYSASFELSTVSDPFSSTIYTAVSAVIAAMYDGFNLKNSDISLSVNAQLPFHDENSKGRTYSAILGIYRVITELGITVSDQSLSITEEDPHVSFAVKAYKFGSDAEFASELSPLELINRLKKEDGLPDFDLLRSLISGKNE